MPKITSYIYTTAGQLVASIKRTDMGGDLVNEGAEFTLRGGSSIGLYQGASASDNQYLFHIKDHKGNVRNMISEAPDATDAYPEIHMVKDYYPFGMALPGRQFSGSIYQQSTSYGFDGKEEDGQFQLNHYPLREYEPRLARWTAPDPFKQFWSPYAALSNDPINRIDPSGGQDYYIDGLPVTELAYERMMRDGFNAVNFSMDTNLNMTDYTEIGGKRVGAHKIEDLLKSYIRYVLGQEIQDAPCKIVRDGSVRASIVKFSDGNYTASDAQHSSLIYGHLSSSEVGDLRSKVVGQMMTTWHHYFTIQRPSLTLGVGVVDASVSTIGASVYGSASITSTIPYNYPDYYAGRELLILGIDISGDPTSTSPLSASVCVGQGIRC